MPAEIEEDCPCLARLPGLHRLVDGDADGMRWLWRRNDPFRTAEEHRRLERRTLLDGRRLDEPLVEQHAHQRRGTVVSQTTGVDTGRDKGVSQGMHLHQRRELTGVAEIVGI